jgi:hypothetical protein
MKRVLCCCSVALAMTGCARFWPDTDIVRITTEDIGDYDVSAIHTASTLTATVCADDPSNAESIVHRLVGQLEGKGYTSMRFDVTGAAAERGQRPMTHVTWTARQGLRVVGRDTAPTPSAPPARCSERAPAPETPAGVRSPEAR